MNNDIIYGIDYKYAKLCVPIGDEMAIYVNLILYSATWVIFVSLFLRLIPVKKQEDSILYSLIWLIAYLLSWAIGSASKYAIVCKIPFINLNYVIPQADLAFLCVFSIQSFQNRVSDKEFFELLHENPKSPYGSTYKKAPIRFTLEVLLLVVHIGFFNWLFFYGYVLGILDCMITTFVYSVPFYFIYKYLMYLILANV
jgi:hypothetical protein